MQNQDFDLQIVADLLNTGETPGQKVSPLRSFGSELSLQLVQWSIAVDYLVKAKLWGNVNRKCMAFCPCHNKSKNNLRHEKKVSGYN